MRISEEDLKTYLTFQKSRDIRERTLDDIRKKLSLFLKITQGDLSGSSILRYIEDRSRLQDPSKYINPVISFLEFLSEFRGEDFSSQISLLQKGKVKKRATKKAFAEEGSIFDVTLEDVHEHLLSLYRSDLKTSTKIIAITASALAASTGLRPEELKRLEKTDLSGSDDFFILKSEKSKTHLERVIPLHPDVRPLLSILLKMRNGLLFPDGTLRYAFSKAGTLQLKQFRKFFVIHSARVGFPEFYRVAIIGHDAESLLRFMKVTQNYYRKFTPEEITAVYLKHWGGVKIVPERIRIR